MKTAILLSGTLYNFRYSLPSLMENLVLPNEADVFLLTSRYNMQRRAPHTEEVIMAEDEDKWYRKTLTQERDESKSITEEDVFFIQRTLGPRLKGIWFIDDMPEYLKHLEQDRKRMMEVVNAYRAESLSKGVPAPFGGFVPEPEDGNIKCVLNQYHHVKKCYELMEEYERLNGISYDVIARVRIDFVTPEVFNFSHYYLNQDTPYLNVCGSFRRDPYEWADEFCWFSKRPTAKKLFSQLDRMGLTDTRKYTTIYKDNDYLFAPEAQFSVLLKESNIPVVNVRIYRSACYTNGGDGYDYLNYKFSRGAIDLEYEYSLVKQGPSDINEHVPVLREYAAKCKHVTELGTRYGNSTIAFMAARPEKFVSYDVAYNEKIDYLKLVAKETGVAFEFRLENPQEIQWTDLLFIDTDHHMEQCEKELRLHAHRTRRYLIFHDVVSFWEKGQGHEKGGGLRYAIEPFMKAHTEWKEIYRAKNNNGLLILERTL